MAGPGMLLVIVEVADDDVEELHRWYDTEHVPEKLATPGFRSARRFRDTERPGRFLALYELDDADLVTSPEYVAQEMSPWATTVMATWLDLDRSVWEELPPADPSGDPTAPREWAGEADPGGRPGER
jgi:hypothetical protein